MSNELTKKHAEMYAGNLKTMVVHQLATVEGTSGPDVAAYSYLVHPVSKKIEVKRVRFCAGNVAGAGTDVDVGVYKGTLAAIAAASAAGAGDLTDLTAVATGAPVEADIAKSTNFDLTLSATPADLDVDGVATAPVGLCFYATSPNASSTFPVGQWIVEYVDRDEA